MVDLKKLNRSDLDLLANSRFGALRARDVPRDWKEQLHADLVERGVIESIEEEEFVGDPESDT